MFRLPWHKLRPCFNLCSHVVHQRLPARYRLVLSPKQKRLLTWVTYLSWVQASKRRGRTAKCSPSRRFLAEKVGVSIWSVTRYSNTLQALGLIDKRRLPFTGKTSTGQKWLGH